MEPIICVCTVLAAMIGIFALLVVLEGKQMTDQDRENLRIAKELSQELAETNAHRLSLVENRVKQLDASIDRMNGVMIRVAETDRQTQEIIRGFLNELEGAK